MARFNYTPNTGFVGTDTFTYKANDGKVDSGTVTATIDVTNNPPIAQADSYSINGGQVLNVPLATGVLSNDTDAEQDSLTAVLVTGPTKGAIDLKSDGHFDYTPNTGFVGSDTFTYKANDGKVDSGTVTATIDVTNNPPIAQADSYSINGGQVLNVPLATGVLSNDTDTDQDSLTAVLVTGPTKGAIDLKSDGSFGYTPKCRICGD